MGYILVFPARLWDQVNPHRAGYPRCMYLMTKLSRQAFPFTTCRHNTTPPLLRPRKALVEQLLRVVIQLLTIPLRRKRHNAEYKAALQLQPIIARPHGQPASNRAPRRRKHELILQPRRRRDPRRQIDEPGEQLDLHLDGQRDEGVDAGLRRGADVGGHRVRQLPAGCRDLAGVERVEVDAAVVEGDGQAGADVDGGRGVDGGADAEVHGRADGEDAGDGDQRVAERGRGVGEGCRVGGGDGGGELDVGGEGGVEVEVEGVEVGAQEAVF